MNEIDILQFVVMALLAVGVWLFPRSPKSPYIGKWVSIQHANKNVGGVQTVQGNVKHDATNWVEVEEKGFRKVIGKAQMFEMVVFEKKPKV
jgi:hypothetical protein